MNPYTVDQFKFDIDAGTISLVIVINTAEGGSFAGITDVDFTLPNKDIKKYSSTAPPGENDIIPTEIEPDKWLFLYDGSDVVDLGIYSAAITYAGTPEESGTTTLVIGDYSEVTRCLINKTLNEVYDCLLIQQLEVIRQAIFSSDADLARDVYEDAMEKCTACVGTGYSGTISGSKIVIEDGIYISI